MIILTENKESVLDEKFNNLMKVIKAGASQKNG